MFYLLVLKNSSEHTWQSFNWIAANKAWRASVDGIKMVWRWDFWFLKTIRGEEFWNQARISWLFSNRQLNWQATAQIHISVQGETKAEQRVSAQFLSGMMPIFGGLQDHIRICFVCSQNATHRRLCRKCLCILKSLITEEFWRKISSHSRKISSSWIYKILDHDSIKSCHQSE